MYLTSPKPDAGEQPDTDLRELSFKKANYSKLAEPIILRWKNGLFLPEAGISSLEAVAAQQAAAEIFLKLLARFIENGRNVTHKPKSNNYAPAVFAKEPEAKAMPRAKAALEQAMQHLFEARQIHVQTYDRHGYERLALGPKP